MYFSLNHKCENIGIVSTLYNTEAENNMNMCQTLLLRLHNFHGISHGIWFSITKVAFTINGSIGCWYNLHH